MKRIVFLLYIFICLCKNGSAQDNGSISNKTSNTNSNEKTIKSILPPQLSYPANESTIDIQYPVLIWLPPRPLYGMMVTYNLRLVEIQKGQTLAEALLQNPPLLNLSGLNNTFLNYPVDATPLRPNGYYAWQVAANYGGQSLGITDIWSFTLKKAANKDNSEMNYPVASKISKERFYITHGVFHFVYNNTANDKTLLYTIKSMDKGMAGIKDLPKVKLRPGMNKLEVDLKNNGKLKNGTYYYLEITDKNRQVYKLMYYYIES